MELFRYYKLVQNCSENKSEFTFSLDKKKKIFTLSLMGGLLFVFLSLFIFSCFLVFGTSFTSTRFLDGLALASLAVISLFGLVFSIAFWVSWITTTVQTPNFSEFSLILQKNYVELNGQQVQSSVTGKIRIVREKNSGETPKRPLFFNDRIFNLILSKATKLELEGDIKATLSVLTKFNRALNYFEKRQLAESLSQYLEIPFRDDFSSFEEELYVKSSYLKRLAYKETLDLGFPENYKFRTTGNAQIILFPTSGTKLRNASFPVVTICLVVLSAYSFLFTDNSPTRSILEVVVLVIVFAFIILLSTLLFFSRIFDNKIILTDDSIMLTKRFLWGKTSEIFASNLEELQEINVIPVFNSTSLLFRSSKGYKYTTARPEQEMIQVSNFLKRLLLEKRVDIH